MKCNSIHNKLIFFVEKELPHNEMQEVQQHLKVCTSCKNFVEELEKSLMVLAADKITAENPFFYTRVSARLEKLRAIPQTTQTQLIRVLQPVAFSLVLLAGIIGGYKLAQPTNMAVTNHQLTQHEMLPFVNEMDAEPIETFLLD